MDEVHLDVHLNTEDVTRKAERLVDLLKEAKTLVSADMVIEHIVSGTTSPGRVKRKKCRPGDGNTQTAQRQPN